MTKIGTEVAHVTRDSDTTVKVKRSKGQLAGGGVIVAAHARLVSLWTLDFAIIANRVI